MTYVQNCKKMTKIRLYKKRSDFETKRNFRIKFDKNACIPVAELC